MGQRVVLKLLGAVAPPLLSLSAGLRAQDTAQVVPAATVRRAVQCVGQRVDYIVIHSSAPTIAMFRGVPVLAEVVRSVHVTTRPEVIRRFLLLEEGKPCDERRRTESERILRAQPFLADAAVIAYENDHGGLDVEVRTSDEASAVLGASVRASTPFVTALRLGNSNLGGNGIYLATDWRHDPLFRDGYGVNFADYQFAGEPNVFSLVARQNPLGDEWNVEAAKPFLTDLQRVAWRGRAGSYNDLVYFRPREDENHAVRLQRKYYDLGGLGRFGPPGRLGLVGLSISRETELPAQQAVLVTPVGLAQDTSSIFIGRYAEHRIARVNMLLGARYLHFVRVEGFDGLTATQDIPVGFQLGTLLGRSVKGLGSHDDDSFVSADFYAGAANQRAAIRLQLQGEGRHVNGPGWDGILTSGRAAQYVKVSPEQTVVASAEWSGGWRMRTPFALTLGEQPGGVRGYSNETVPGAQRVIARLENRTFVGRPFGLGDAGVAFFADAGRMWAGDVPFGRSTPIRTSVGVSLLSAFPARSARLWRLDIALPLNPAGHRSLEFGIGSTDRTLFFWREPDDVRLARERTVPSSIFNWP